MNTNQNPNTPVECGAKQTCNGVELAERFVDLYSNAKANTGRQIALTEIFDGIRFGDWRKVVEEYREAKSAGKAERAKLIKQSAPAITPCGTFSPTRNRENIAMATGCIVVDVDHLASLGKAEEVRNRIGADPHCLGAFLSIGGLGVKGIFFVGSCADDAEVKAAFGALAQYLREQHSIEVDASGKDICRLCFLSYDEQIVVKTGPVLPFLLRTEAPQPKPGPTPAPSAMTSHAPSHAADEAIVKDALRVMDAGCAYGEWLRVACAVKNGLGDSGFSVFDSWSATAPEKYTPLDTRKLWDSIQPNGGVTVATLFKMAADRGWVNPRGRHEQPSQSVPVDAILETVADARDEERDEPKAKPKPWAGITEEQVLEAIAGTQLEKMVKVLSAVTNPPLPIQLTLPKAIALAGCALSQPIPFDVKTETRKGLELAKLIINTAGGQLCNVMTCIVAASGCGKDVGNIPTRIAQQHDVALGHAGSAEGMADAYRTNGAGLLTISELGPYLDSKTWQHKATGLLTQVFNQHSAKIVLSKRNGEPRDIPYCAPNIIANIQPNVLASVGDTLLMDSGFLPRFLFSYMAEIRSWRPTTGAIDFAPLSAAFIVYLNAEGRVEVPEGYLQGVMDEFLSNDAPLSGHYNRLVNEYGPRIAVMLAVSPSNTRNIVISDDHWRRTGILLRWFFSMAEQVLVSIGEPEHVRRMEDRLDRMRKWIERHPKGVLKSVFSKRFFERGTTAFDRDRDLNELEVRGRIVQQAQGKGTLLRAIK